MYGCLAIVIVGIIMSICVSIGGFVPIILGSGISFWIVQALLKAQPVDKE